MVPMWFFPVAIAAGNTVVLKPSREGPVGRAVDRRPVGRGRPARRRVQRPAGRQGRRRRAADPPRRSRPSRSSAPPRSRSTSTRPAPLHGKRVQALGGAKNHTVVLPDADLDLAADAAVNAGFGSAGERCMAISAARGRRPGRRRAGRQDRRAHRRTLKIGDGTPRTPTWARWSPRRTATGSPSYIDAGEADGATRRRRRARTSQVDGEADGFWLGPTLIDHVTPEMSVYTDEIFGPVLVGRAGRHLRRGAGAGQRQPVRQRHRDLHQRRRRGPPLPERGRGRHGRHQRADPGADGLLLASAAGRRRCSATPTPTAPRACTSSPAARSSPAGGSTRATAASISASPRTTEPEKEHAP